MTEKDNRFQETVEKMIMRDEGELFFHKFQEEIEEKQRSAFIDGYKYAIRILEDGLVRLDLKEGGI